MSSRRMAVLFTDMEGSVELSSERGDESAMELVRVHETLARQAAARHGGVVIKSTGDGYLLAFGSTCDAVAAALEVRNALADHNAASPADPVNVRMGVNVGPVIEESGDLYGLAVNAAARITAKATRGQVLVSGDVRDELSDGDTASWQFLDRGLFWLKGLREQWRLYEVTDREPADPVAHVSGRLPFVDRDEQRARLRKHVDAANDGRGGFVLVTGAPGSGKSRLVEEVGLEARARGLQFLIGRCYETAEGLAYGPIVEVLELVERSLPEDAFRDIVGEDAGEIARLLPQLRTQWDDAAPERPLPVQEARTSLFAALRQVLARVAAVRPLVVLIDDLHWADDATLRFVEYLAAELPGLPISVIATYGGEDVSASAPFRLFVSGLHRRRLVETVEVPPLDEQHVAELLRALGGGEAPPALVAQLHEATGGNPFFVEEVIRQLIDAQQLLDASGRWLPTAGAADVEVPDSVRFVIEDRLAKLSPATRNVLVTAAVVGRDFGFELLEALADLSEDELLDALDEAERTRLVMASNENGFVRFRFAHGLIRRTLAAEMSLTRRQRLHVQVAEALEHVYASTLDEYAADIAFHLVEAGRWADAELTARFLLLAGDRALEAAAYEEALRHFDRALARSPMSDARARAAVLEKMGMAERSLGHLDDALALWNEALDAYDRVGANDEVARLCLTAGIQVAWWRRGSEVISLVDRGLLALGDDDTPLRGGLLALAGGVASQAGSYDQATRLLDDALAIARRHGDDGVLGLALYSLAVHHFSYYQYENVVSIGKASMKHLRRAGDLWNLANVQGYVSASLGWLGRVDEADRVGAETQVFARRLGNLSAYVFGEGGRAFREIGTQPAVGVLQRRGEEALQLGTDLGFAWLTSIGHTRLGLAAFWDGRWEDALEEVEKAARGELRTASGGHLGRLFMIHAYLGNREEALALIAEAEPALPVVGRPNSGTSWTLALAAVEALFVLGERERAARLYPTVIDHAATGTVMRSWDYRLVSTLAGIAAGCGGDLSLADRHFEHAERVARKLPMRHEEADALRFRAAVHLGAGDGDGAVDRNVARMLERAIDIYDELGMPRHAALASTMAADAQSSKTGSLFSK
ncbi:MAG TPA: AAA family ATPase [Acidimicrobiales bacterium]|nr:AAA family ATPase [Acidimicrobiales bacterium]